ncbi:peptidase domain-containing ABC transporter [uncultured Roseivirga sp.]|uniref:peptidase domain-containing ABC transporter n=1 Tax=uncultured Roseivirga sp. TaxID=543088 RepID=UPI0025882A49|nr:peptidase domain-containing ABC transporter [uncultured Roseivirga sp.]|tara:strand:- start:11 stop:2182 length:2172 start_codon:yes stop_codon:yes gene_type:complete
MARSPKHFKQRDQSDCGVTCLYTLIKYYEGEVSLEKLREFSGTSKEGTTLLGLYQAANQIGLDAEGFEAEIEHLKTLEHPAILHVIIEGKLQHYVVVFGYENQKFLISDPAKGIEYITEEELAKIWRSRALLLVKPTDRLERVQEQKGRKKEWLLSLVREDYPILGIATFLGIVISILGISTAIFTQKLIDDIIPSQDSERLILGLALLTILLLARSGVLYLRTLLILRQSKDFNNRIIQKFYGALLYLPKRFFDTRKTGELIARMNDTNRIQRTISFVLGDTLIQLLLGITSLAFVFTYSWQVGLLLLAFVPIYIFLVWKYTKPITTGQREVMQAYAMNESNYVDTIQGIEVIKNQNKESVFSKITETIYGHFQSKVYDLGLVGNKYGVYTQIIGVIAMTGVLAFSSFLVIQETLQLGELVALLSMAGGLFPAIEAVARANIQIREAKIAFDRMYEFTAIEPETNENDTVQEMSNIQRLQVENLSFRFPGRKQLLKNINLELNKGELVCLLGESGGGKSTFLQILQKFYFPEEGKISIDGHDYREIHTKTVRSKIGVVPQEIKIFNGSLLDNILLGETITDIKTLEDFMVSLGFDQYFKEFPQGYATILGEEGVNISGGQKQLVGLARALWSNPEILLLDEATSALDRKTEHFVLNLLDRLKSYKLILLVTHRITTAAKADKIYILEENAITSCGTPSELFESDNFFSEFYQENNLALVSAI